MDRRAVHKTAAPCVNRRESKLFVVLLSPNPPPPPISFHSFSPIPLSILFYLFNSIQFYSTLPYIFLFLRFSSPSLMIRMITSYYQYVITSLVAIELTVPANEWPFALIPHTFDANVAMQFDLSAHSKMMLKLEQIA